MSGDRPGAGRIDGPAAQTKARAIRALRRRRRECFGAAAALLNDPVWDILLHLFIDRARGGQSVVAAAAASGVAHTIARRWILALEEVGLVVCTSPETNDDIRISDAGVAAMAGYLASIDELTLVDGGPSSPAG